jgi:hypothetical protein
MIARTHTYQHARHPHGELRERQGGELRERQTATAGELRERRQVDVDGLVTMSWQQNTSRPPWLATPSTRACRVD